MKEVIEVGQVWRDKDLRRATRELRVESINNEYAEVSVRQGTFGEFGQRRSRIRLDRFPRYELKQDDAAAEQMESPVHGINAHIEDEMAKAA